MSGVVLIGEEAPRKLQELARHRFIEKMYAEILIDMQICEIEGWDRMEFINQLRDALKFGGREDDGKRSERESRPHSEEL